MISYRDEIDGLRAVAVIPVILYHAGFSTLFSGGYVGVDIFFVISGYLITSVIQNECDNQTFSILNFYERRCRRILPALFLILFLTIPCAYHWMSPDQLREFGQTLVSIILLSSNFFFWWKDDGYFATWTDLNPLVHTWSLAVEEQFYFVFPLVCYFFNHNKQQLYKILLAAGMISFFLAQWGDNWYSFRDGNFRMFAQHSWATFYLPTGRVWELLLGSFAAFYLRNNDPTKEFESKWRQLLTLLGLVCIAISIVFLNNDWIYPFPNCYTLLPTCGAVLIIIFGDKTTIVGSILCQPLIRGIGLISYSAYLWHQPLLAFLRIRFNESPPFSDIVIAIIAVIPLSTFSYIYVEQPFRQKSKFDRKRIFFGAAVATLVTFVLALLVIQSAQNPSEAPEQEDTYLFDLKNYGSMSYTHGAYYQNAKRKVVLSDPWVTPPEILLIGDSNSQDFYNIITEGNHLTNYKIRPVYIHFECQIYMGPEDRERFIHPKFKQACRNAHHISAVLPLIREAKIIIIVALWKVWSAQRLAGTLKLLNITDKQRFIIVGGKHFGEYDLKFYINKTKEFRVEQYNYPLPWAMEANDLVSEAADPSIFINTMKLICPREDRKCPLFTPEGKLISYDGYHLTKHGVAYVGNLLFSQKLLKEL